MQRITNKKIMNFLFFIVVLEKAIIVLLHNNKPNNPQLDNIDTINEWQSVAPIPSPKRGRFKKYLKLSMMEVKRTASEEELKAPTVPELIICEIVFPNCLNLVA